MNIPEEMKRAQTLIDRKEFGDALGVLQLVVESARVENHTLLVEALILLSSVLRETESDVVIRAPSELAVLTEARSLSNPTERRDEWMMLTRRIVSCCVSLERPDEAARALEQAFEKSSPPGDLLMAHDFAMWGRLDIELGRPKDAVQHLLRCLDLERKKPSGTPSAVSLALLGRAYHLCEMREEAIANLERALALSKRDGQQAQSKARAEVEEWLLEARSNSNRRPGS